MNGTPSSDLSNYALYFYGSISYRLPFFIAAVSILAVLNSFVSG
jgi:hypothetical protein